jgi:dihydrodipicolinate synthase/N-acetylneuraminate lyase
MAQENNQQPPAGGQQAQQIQIKIEDKVLRGVYSNMMQVAHTPEEFVLDFMNIVGTAGIVSSRVIVSPKHMKRIVAALEDNLKRYEAQHGTIEAGQDPANNFGFRTE